ncbi:MAG: phosphatidate cytidylyltransferase [Deltaproteobacteria bacterium]|nr:phosphatidate cytidylyltransferase [Deltaproteobacteria bacterium]
MKSPSNLVMRVLTALVFAPALLVLIWWGGLPLALACVVITWLMLREFVRLTLPGGPLHLRAAAWLTATVLALRTVDLLPSAPLDLLVPAAALLLLSTALVRPDPIETSVARAATALLGAVYCGALFPCLYRLREMEPGYAVMALLCTWAADTGAYFAGRAFGRHKLYPKVSPGKTVEGAVGAVAVAVAVAFALRGFFALPLSTAHTVVVGCILALFGIIGDLCESLIKRAVGAKDSGTLIPGHGGVLDRFDGVMFAAPAMYLYLVWILAPSSF